MTITEVVPLGDFTADGQQFRAWALRSEPRPGVTLWSLYGVPVTDGAAPSPAATPTRNVAVPGIGA